MRNVDQQLHLYQSGFIGRPNFEHEYKDATTEVQAANTFMYRLVFTRTKDNPLAINRRIDELYRTLTERATNILNFKHRHAYLEELVSVLADQNLYQWAMIQQNSPLFSDLHKRFIEDTFGFIQTGRRTMSLHNWQALFTRAQFDFAAHRAKFDASFLEHGRMGYQDWDFDQAFSRWCAWPNGMEDLAHTFWLVYGSGAGNR